jgi:hypothetical protein
VSVSYTLRYGHWDMHESMWSVGDPEKWSPMVSAHFAGGNKRSSRQLAPDPRSLQPMELSLDTLIQTSWIIAERRSRPTKISSHISSSFK